TVSRFCNMALSSPLHTFSRPTPMCIALGWRIDRRWRLRNSRSISRCGKAVSTRRLREKVMRLTAAALALFLSVISALAQDKPVQLRFSHWVPTAHPMHAAAVAWAESIEKASGGSIKIAIFPAQQLGKAFDHYNMARDGIAD